MQQSLTDSLECVVVLKTRLWIVHSSFIYWNFVFAIYYQLTKYGTSKIDVWFNTYALELWMTHIMYKLINMKHRSMYIIDADVILLVC